MEAYIVIVQSAILAVQVLCEKRISVTNNFRNKIALEVLKASPVNTVVSPLALKMPLCKLTAAATGATKVELMSALGIEREIQMNCYASVRTQVMIAQLSELTMHNRMYFNDSLDVDPGFLNQSLTEYGVRIGKVGFRLQKAAAKFINHWAATETFYRVSNLIDEDDIDASTSMILLSGLHFKGNWEEPFDIRFSKQKIFRDETNQPVYVSMMFRQSNFDYVDDPNYDVKVLSLRFTSMGSSITFVMPTKKDGIPALLEKLSTDPSMMNKLRSRLTNSYMKFFLPCIKIKTYVDWTDFLRLVGINKILDANNTDLNGILKNSNKSEVPVHLSLAKQKVFFDIDEMGVTRNLPRVQEREIREMLHLTNVEEFVLDQPFYFVVTLENGGYRQDLFNGVYRRPEPV